MTPAPKIATVRMTGKYAVGGLRVAVASAPHPSGREPTPHAAGNGRAVCAPRSREREPGVQPLDSKERTKNMVFAGRSAIRRMR